jgi:hypothetical protein
VTVDRKVRRQSVSARVSGTRWIFRNNLAVEGGFAGLRLDTPPTNAPNKTPAPETRCPATRTGFMVVRRLLRIGTSTPGSASLAA